MQKLSEHVPLISRVGNWARWETLTLLGLLSVYVALAAYKIHLPGIYYDEILPLAPATGERPYLKWFGLPLMVFPYIGALKFWIYAPIFALFGVSPVSIRLPTILISCGTLALGYSLVRRILTPRWAVAFTGACAVHPGFVFLTKVDWGPIALMLFLKALCLVLLFKWLEGSQRICWSLIGVCMLGFFDKFNFIWFVVALAFSTSAIYGPEIFRKLKTTPVRQLLAIAIALLVIGLLVLWIVYPLLRTSQISAFSGRFSHIWSLYKSMSTGADTAYMWFKSPPAVPSWTGWGVLTVTAIFLVLTFVSYCLHANAKKSVDTRAIKFCLWSLLMFGIIWLEIALTPQAGGPHHLIMVFPFDLLSGFSAAFLFVSTFSEMRRSVLLLEGCVLLIYVASNLRSLEMHFRKFRDMSSFRGRWSPHVELLAAFLNEKAKNVDFICTIDWGIGLELRALCRPKIRRKVSDHWPAFVDWSPDRPDATTEIARLFPSGKKALYVSFVPRESVFPHALENFERMRVTAGDTTKIVADVSPAIAETYQIFEKPANGMDRQ